MFNKDFLKTLTVLYAEDDDAIRNSLSNILNKVFKKVILCEDGQAGVDNYLKYSKEFDFDVIISDINMPNLNGLGMVKKIREVNPDIPVIMTTAHGESNYLMEAIKLNVSGYTLKPINTKELLVSVQKYCEIKRNQKLIVQKEAELSEYMNVIDNIATILKVDNKDIITHSNPFFQEISEYSNDELKNSNILDFIHQDSLNTTYKDMISSINSNKTWKGKLKLTCKDGEVFHLRTTAIPQGNNDTGKVTGYIFIGFLADEEEQEKAQTMHQVRLNMMEQKKKVLTLTKEVKELRKTQGSPQTLEFLKNERILKSTLKEERNKSMNLVKQVEYYESELAKQQEKINAIAKSEREKREEISKKIKDLSKENAILKENLITANNKITAMKPKPKYVE